MYDSYIGITDFTDFTQVSHMSEVLRSHEGSQDRRLHVGVMMSRKTLLGEPTKWADAFPPKEKIASIFESPLTMNCLHYADYDGIDIEENLLEAIKWGGDGINAVQLDMCWPDPEAVQRAIARSGKDLEVILQVGGKALKDAEGDDITPEELVARLEDYSPLIDFVLLDKSGGKGVGMDAEALRPYARAVAKHYPHFGITAAGGLGPHSLHLVEPLIEEFPTISIDAQGRLRPSGNALDPIDWNMAAEYLHRSLDLFDRESV